MRTCCHILLLLHGEILAFIPALFFLGSAALMVAALVWGRLAGCVAKIGCQLL
jgi:hypothetical protein